MTNGLLDGVFELLVLVPVPVALPPLTLDEEDGEGCFDRGEPVREEEVSGPSREEGSRTDQGCASEEGFVVVVVEADGEPVDDAVTEVAADDGAVDEDGRGKGLVRSYNKTWESSPGKKKKKTRQEKNSKKRFKRDCQISYGRVDNGDER